MDVQHHQSSQRHTILHVEFSSDQLDDVVNLSVVQLVVLVQSLRASFDGLGYILCPVKLRHTKYGLSGVIPHPVNTLRLRVVGFCSDDRLRGNVAIIQCFVLLIWVLYFIWFQYLQVLFNCLFYH